MDNNICLIEILITFKKFIYLTCKCRNTTNIELYHYANVREMIYDIEKKLLNFSVIKFDFDMILWSKKGKNWNKWSINRWKKNKWINYGWKSIKLQLQLLL